MTSRTGTNSGEFTFPPAYSFPPFFTVQPVEATWSKQRALWLDLIRQYAAHHGLTRISLQWLRAPAPAANAAASAPVPAAAAAAVAASAGNERDVRLVNALFRNESIDRQLPAEGVRLLLDALAAEGWGVWEDGSAAGGGGGGGAIPRSHFLLSPSRRLSEMGEAIWAHAHALGEGSGLLTLYELQTADTMKGAVFYGADALLLLGAVRWLESRGRCAVLPSPVVAETGVKMLG